MGNRSSVLTGVPACEQLEPRLLLDGDVTVSVIAGNLQIVGDAYDNVIVLTRDDGTVTVTPDGNTSINGGDAGLAADFDDVAGNIRIRMGEGNDSVTITAQDVLVGAEEGPEASVGMANNVVIIIDRDPGFAVGEGYRDLTVDMGGGDDVLTLAGVAARNISIQLGHGDNTATITGCDPDEEEGGSEDLSTVVLRNLTVRGLSGNDVVGIAGAIVGGNLTSMLNGGENTLALSPYAGTDTSYDLLVGRNLSVRNSREGGNNSIAIQDSSDAGAVIVTGNVLLAMGIGNDDLTVSSAAEFSVGGNLIVRGSVGANQISLTDVTVGGSANILTGDGTDQVDLLGIVVGRSCNVGLANGVGTLNVDAGTVNDASSIGGALTVNLGGADDAFNLANLGARSILANGGTGTNVLSEDPLTVDVTGAKQYVNFVA